ncbi:hypothetical protein ABPG73_016976 [Tetrahymena malaccensis]
MNPNFKCIQFELLGGSKKQNNQACQLDDHTIKKKHKYEDRNSYRMMIEEQQNSNFCQQIKESIQNIIELLNSQPVICQTQSDKLKEDNIQNFQVKHNINNGQEYMIEQLVACKVIEIGDNESIQNQISLKDLITKADKSKQKLKEEELDFLNSIFKLGDYIISGGEADIFVNIKQQVAFRVIKIEDGETLTKNDTTGPQGICSTFDLYELQTAGLFKLKPVLDKRSCKKRKCMTIATLSEQNKIQ